MAFQSDIGICSSENCEFVGFEDSTGNYNATTNSTGYRTTDVPEITRVQTTAQGATTSTVGNAEYFLVSTLQTDYYVWYDVDSGATDPAVASRTGIEVDISAGDSAATVATNTVTAITAFDFGTDPGFTAATVSDLLTITNIQNGNVTNASTPSNTTGFTITVLQAGTWTDIGTSDVTAAFIEFEVPGVTYSPRTFEADGTSIVNITTDTITVSGHGYSTRDAILLESENSTSTLPTGLSENTLYYVIKTDVDNFQLSTSPENATVGTVVDITATGSDTVTIKTNVISVYPTLPNTAGTQFAVDGTDLDYSTTTAFPDGLYRIRYVIVGNGGGTAFTKEVTREFLVYCQKNCCVYDMIAQIPELECSCDDERIDRALFAFSYLQALKLAAGSGQATRASNINTTLTTLCAQNNCTSC